MNMSIAGLGAGMPHAVSGASATMRMPPQQKMSNLYNQIDTSGSGSITQAQFDQAFQTMNPPGPFKAAGADSVWNALDPTGSGQVTRQNFINGMKNLMVELRRDHGGASNTATAATGALNSLGS